MKLGQNEMRFPSRLFTFIPLTREAQVLRECRGGKASGNFYLKYITLTRYFFAQRVKHNARRRNTRATCATFSRRALAIFYRIHFRLRIPERE